MFGVGPRQLYPTYPGRLGYIAPQPTPSFRNSTLPFVAGQSVEVDDHPHFSPNDEFETDNRQMVNKIFGGLEVNPPYKYRFIAHVEVRNMTLSNY